MGVGVPLVGTLGAHQGRPYALPTLGAHKGRPYAARRSNLPKVS